jgi:hypothetical protein
LTDPKKRVNLYRIAKQMKRDKMLLEENMLKIAKGRSEWKRKKLWSVGEITLRNF